MADQLYMYSTTISDVGTVRSNNQDSSFAGEHLVAICDGMGGHAGGDTASTIAVRSLAHIETDSANGDVARAIHMMTVSVMAAHDAIVGKAKRERKLAGMGTTVTAMTLVPPYWVIAHIGDSRAYLLRDGKLQQLTSDHSYVQHLIDTKRITESEARNHPKRNVVMRVLGDFDIDPHPDVAIRRAQLGDRLLLCSDGVCGVLADETLEEVLSSVANPEECAQQIVAMALKGGSTDNSTAVIADAIVALNADQFDLPHQTPLVGGAASSNLEAIADIINEPVASAPALFYGKDSPAQRAAALMQSDDGDAHDVPQQQIAQPSSVREDSGELKDPDTGEIPVVRKSNGRVSADPNDPEVQQAIHEEYLIEKKAKRTKRTRNRIIALIITGVLILAAALGVWGAYSWSQKQYYVATHDGVVSVYQGVPTNLFGIALSHPVHNTTLKVSDLPQQWQDRLEDAITVDNYDEALSHIELIRKQLREYQKELEKNTSKQSTAQQSTKSTTKPSSSSKSSSTRSHGSTTD